MNALLSPGRSARYQIPIVVAVCLLFCTDVAWAGACLCLKSNGNAITEFSCKEQPGNNECGAHCASTGFPGSEFYAEETCDSLHKKIKRQEIEVPVPDLTITNEVVEIIDIATGKVIEQQIINLFSNDERLRAASRNEGIAGSIRAAAVPQPGQTTRRILDAEASFGPGTDSFEIPMAYGAGWHTTNDFVGDFKLRLVQQISSPNLYDVFVTEVNTVATSMDLNGFDTGNLTGVLNLNAPNSGLYDDSTGDITILFSQFLTADAFPDSPMLTYTTYSGNCPDCLSGNQAFQLSGDSLYVSPVE